MGRAKARLGQPGDRHRHQSGDRRASASP